MDPVVLTGTAVQKAPTELRRVRVAEPTYGRNETDFSLVRCTQKSERHVMVNLENLPLGVVVLDRPSIYLLTGMEDMYE